MAFGGFPAEGLAFLSALTENNTREWFEANKAVYIKTLQEPALAFIGDVGERLQEISPAIRYDTRTNGSGSLMRINRDTRFSKDKSPYKDNISMMFWEGAGKKTEEPGFGMRIMDGSAGIIAGLFGFDKAMLEAYREAVLDDRYGVELDKLIKTLTKNGYEVIGGEAYKSVPRGYDAEHPRAEYLKYRGLYARYGDFPAEALAKASFVDEVVSHFKAMAPLQQWLVKVKQTI